MTCSTKNVLRLTDDELSEITRAFRPGRYTGELLLALARQKSAFDNAADEQKAGAAHSMFIAATNLLADCLGEDALSKLYGSDPHEEAPNEDHLKALARRLFIVSDIFVHHNRFARSSLETAIDELQAIAGGDTPRLFVAPKGKQGQNNNKFRLAQHKLRALVWEQFLKSQGNNPGDAQNAVASAFGCPWGTIYAWRSRVIEYLGQERFDKAMRDAERGLSAEIGLVRSSEEAVSRMAEHGAAYRAENARRLKAVD